MALYALALALLLASQHTQSFQPSRLAFERHRVSLTERSVSASVSRDYPAEEGGNSLGNATLSYMASLSSALSEEDLEQDAADKKRLQVMNRIAGAYKVTLPLKQRSLGMSVVKVDRSGQAPEVELDLDTMRITMVPEGTDRESLDVSALVESLDPSFSGLVVSSVDKESPAWRQGVRPGDVLYAVSATVGDALWPKSTLEGVQSALSSRQLTSGSVAVEFRRVAAHVDNKFELTLTRPIGLVLHESEDGYVEVTGFTSNAPTLVKCAVRVGDRVLAVDSSLGEQMWPVSTVEGVISAVTSRLPGQTIKMRFERPLTNVEATLTDEVITAPRNAVVDEIVAPTETSTDKKQLIVRCREVLRRYTNEENLLPVQTRFRGKYDVAAIVADKVVDALASASATIDPVTLSMIMSAYLSCRRFDGAIRIFEAATGFSADGSLNAPMDPITGRDGNLIVPSESALNIYTVTALLRAHTMNGDIFSVSRVLAALEGRSGEVVGAAEVAPWPWTGSYGTLQPDTQCYNTAISAAEKIGGEEAMFLAFDVFDRMADPSAPNPSSKPVKDVVTYNTLISALSNAGRSHEAFSLFDTMKRAGVRPDKYTYTSLIKACSSDGDVQELLYDMKESGVEADVVTYNTLIKSLCEQRRWTQATRLVTEMEARDIEPDSMTYGYLMSAMLKSEKPNACLALFESAYSNAKTTALTENVHLYTTAVTAASMLGDHERALELVARMNAVGIKPNLKTLTAVVGACLSSRKPELAVQLFDRIGEPDGYALVQGIRALCESHEAARALDILKEQQRGQESTLSGREIMSAYNTVMKTALMSNDYTIARGTLADLLRKGYIPNKGMFSNMISRMASADVVSSEEDADKLFSFAVHTIDSLLKRNLPLEGRFYAATLFLGNRLGGLHRKIVSLMALSKTSDGENVKSLIATEEPSPAASFPGWENLLVNYDAYKGELSPEQLPSLPVRVSRRDIGKVLKAEKVVTFVQGSQASKTRKRKQTIASR